MRKRDMQNRKRKLERIEFEMKKGRRCTPLLSGPKLNYPLQQISYMLQQIEDTNDRKFNVINRPINSVSLQ
jgi:hypothetical protein